MKVMKSMLLNLQKILSHQSPEHLFSSNSDISDILLLLDPYTRAHSFRARAVALQIGESLDVSPEILSNLGTAALFHDVGKIFLSQDILYANRELSVAEKREIRRHPFIGARVWLEHGGSSDIAAAILTHHERYDGKGYPLGLRGTQIPLISRILAIADAFDAMISERPYSQSVDQRLAVKRIREGSGTHFDPYIVEKAFYTEREKLFLEQMRARNMN